MFLPLKRAECNFMEVISVVKCLFLTYQVEGQYKRGIFAILCELPAQLLTCSCCHSAGRYNAFLYMICLSGIGVLGQPTPRALESWGGSMRIVYLGLDGLPKFVLIQKNTLQ